MQACRKDTNYNNDPALVNKIMDAFVNAGFVRLGNGNRCLNVKRVSADRFQHGRSRRLPPQRAGVELHQHRRRPCLVQGRRGQTEEEMRRASP